MYNNFGILKDENLIYYLLPISNYSELMMFRRGVNLAIELLTRNFDEIEEGTYMTATEELDAINLLGRLQLALTCYDVDTSDIIDEKIAEL